jgi:hypothetical protein
MCKEHLEGWTKNYLGGPSNTCIGETAAAGAVLTGIPLRGLLGVLWTEIFCPVPPAKKRDLNIHMFVPVQNSWFVTFWCLKYPMILSTTFILFSSGLELDWSNGRGEVSSVRVGLKCKLSEEKEGAYVMSFLGGRQQQSSYTHHYCWFLSYLN